MTDKIFEAAQAAVILWQKGYNLHDMIGMIAKLIQQNDNITELLKMEILKEVSLLKIRMAENLCTLIQLTGFLAKICDISRKKKTS